MWLKALSSPEQSAKVGLSKLLQQKAIALTQSIAITPIQSIAAVMQGRGERYRERIAGVSERVVGHIEAMCPDEILTRSAQFEKIDTIARRTFGLKRGAV
jgi:hypothetical protein